MNYIRPYYIILGRISKVVCLSMNSFKRSRIWLNSDFNMSFVHIDVIDYKHYKTDVTLAFGHLLSYSLSLKAF